ncbi:MAG TPA: hypothetical protein VFA11_14665 [Acidimicrobiales bacterium]|nr:hypothetical protein [Acidimicrobiales bacterium]
MTLQQDQVAEIKALVDSGQVPSISRFVQHAVGVALDDMAGWGAHVAEALRQTGGPLSKGERAWADSVLGVAPRQHSAAGAGATGPGR